MRCGSFCGGASLSGQRYALVSSDRHVRTVVYGFNGSFITMSHRLMPLVVRRAIATAGFNRKMVRDGGNTTLLYLR
jgi:hypothetical protein